MAIVIEGFDNSGKTTLAKSIGLDVISAGPRPRTWRDVQRCMDEQQSAARLPLVMDRVTCLSHPIYTNNPDWRCSEALKEMLGTHHCVLIYCRPPLETILDFSKHQVKNYDDQRHLDWLQKNARDIIARYDSVMKKVPHLKYDWTDPNNAMVQEAFNAQFSYGAWKRCSDLLKQA